MIRCDFTIELGNDMITYCVRPLNHEGRHEPPRPLCNLCKALHQWWQKNYPDESNSFYRPTEPLKCQIPATSAVASAEAIAENNQPPDNSTKS